MVSTAFKGRQIKREVKERSLSKLDPQKDWMEMIEKYIKF